MKSFIFSSFFLLILSSNAFAGLCTANISRVCKPNTACRNTETLTAIKNNADECLQHAQSYCKVYLSDSVTSKQVKASFEGQSLSGGQNLCK